MPYPYRRGRTVTITRFTLNQRTRERTPVEDQPAPVPQCAWDPGSTRETKGGDQVTQAPRFFGPYDLDVTTDDEITVAGVDGVFQVEGEILRWRNDLTATEHCCEVNLTRQRGAK